MSPRYTAAHWGSYRIAGVDGPPRLDPLEGDPSPSLIGTGWLDAVQDRQARILTPMIRQEWLKKRDRLSRCRDEFVSVSWDEALDLAAAELSRVIQEHGNNAIFAGSYGWASAGRFHHAQSQLRRFLNTVGGFTYSKNTYSHAAAEVLLPFISGMSNRVFQDGMTSWSQIARECELLVAFGGVSGRTAQITSSGTTTHEVETWLDRACSSGMQLVNVSPLRTDVDTRHSTQWVPLRPNTDTALMLGMAFALLETGAHDVTFLETRTQGWAALECYIRGATDGVAKTPEWASGVCDVPASVIRDLAARMASCRTMISVAWGIQRAHHGEQPLWMGLALAAMLGQIGQAGGGFGFGYGSTTPVGRPARLIPWPSVPQGQNPVADFIPVARITDLLLNPGGSCEYNGKRLTYPDTRLVYWAGGNPFHHHQDLHRLEAAWTRPDTVIVNDIWWTATARRADIVFPVTSPLERQDIMMNRRDPTLLLMAQAIPVVGQARSDHAVFKGLAARMGTLDEFSQGRTEAEWLAWLWQEARVVGEEHGITLPAWSAFCEMGRFDCPNMLKERTQFQPFADDPLAHPLATESGRIELQSDAIAALALQDCPGHPSWLPPCEWLGQPRDNKTWLHLMSGQPAARLHGQLDNGSTSRSRKVNGREAVYLHPECAAHHAIEDGDVVLLFNARGRCLAGAILSSEMRPDVVALATGAWLDIQTIEGRDIEVHGNPNVLTPDIGCSSLSQGNSAHTALVRIEKWSGPVPEVRVLEPPTVHGQMP